ncbi:hypothetical protein J2848_005310 [Azospirillum lipoferum]|nr:MULTISPECIES: hypothetical protein [Azospirillum]MCP1613614.1 hypothetical protein [Azospirillum lipoferum]MDW5532376.1 hypothetical protein [Azospirillum sp. NL1]
MTAIRIVIVEDQQPIRRALASLLSPGAEAGLCHARIHLAQ